MLVLLGLRRLLCEASVDGAGETGLNGGADLSSTGVPTSESSALGTSVCCLSRSSLAQSGSEGIGSAARGALRWVKASRRLGIEGRLMLRKWLTVVERDREVDTPGASGSTIVRSAAAIELVSC